MDMLYNFIEVAAYSFVLGCFGALGMVGSFVVVAWFAGLTEDEIKLGH